MQKDLLNDFDVSGLDLERTVVRCATQEEADIFLKYLCYKGVWNHLDIQDLSKQWKQHGDATCYHISQNRWCYNSWYAENYPELRIVDFCDIYKNYTQQEVSDYKISFDEIMGDFE